MSQLPHLHSSTITFDPSKPPIAVLAAHSALPSSFHSQIALTPSTTPLATPTLTFSSSSPSSSSSSSSPSSSGCSSSGPVFQGSVLILRYLGRLSGSLCPLYGADDIESISVDFFLDLSRLLNQKDSLVENAKELDSHLSIRSVLVGYQATIADFSVYEQLICNQRWLNFTKTAASQFPHLFRWFGYIQSLPAMQTALTARSRVESERAAKKLASSSSASLDIDLPGAEQGKVVTRFPPEPSGFLHIGHSKAALLNDYVARSYGGKLILRFDDTNPKKEKEEYVENIYRDLKTLGIHWDMLSHTSDHFDRIQQYAIQMIRDGLAYIDDTPVEQLRKWRMDGIESPGRNAPVEENLRRFQEMLDGTEDGMKCCLRAKIDMQLKNKAMRDPVIYRCNLTPHHRTGSKFKAYPTYDFACPLVDSIEGVTHALRTNEYRDRNEQYAWMLKAMKLRNVVIRDYSRLNFVYTTLSKRKLTWFVDTKRVDSWNDPRMPTVQGILRRGMTVEALRKFCIQQGFSQSVATMEWDKIWTVNKQIIDPKAPRYTAIDASSPALLVLTNVPSSSVEAITMPLHQKDSSIGTKIITRSNSLYLEQDDAKTIVEGEEVTLMAYGNAIVKKIEKDTNGIVTKLTAEFNPKGDVKKTDKKLTWLDASTEHVKDHIGVKLVELDTLITVAKVEEDMDFDKIVNPKTWFESPALGEPALRSVAQGDIIQIQRRGYFIADCVYGGVGKPLVLIMIPDGKMNAVSVLSSKIDKAKTFGGAKSQQ